MAGTRPAMTKVRLWRDRKAEELTAGALRHAGARPRDDIVDAVALLVEGGEHRAVEHAAARQLDPQRIDEAAVDQDFVVHVRAGREARRADVADHLALADAGAGLGRARERGHVACLLYTSDAADDLLC